MLKNCEESILPHSIIQNLRVSTFALRIVIVVSFKMFTRQIRVIAFILVSSTSEGHKHIFQMNDTYTIPERLSSCGSVVLVS